MKSQSLILFIAFTTSTFAQSSKAISVFSFVKIKNNKTAEARYFYENNWRVFREAALKMGYIKSYHIYDTKADSLANFDLILVTDYTDEAQYKHGEAHFSQIIKETRPTGSKFLNELKPADFRKVYDTVGESAMLQER